MNDDQGHDQVHHDARDCGRGEVDQGHVRVNGIVKDKVRGDEEEENSMPTHVVWKSLERGEICSHDT